jgi:hypothetical protein
MMVCRDLRGNNEPSENGIRHRGGDWEPEGRSPEGQVGVDSGRRAICYYLVFASEFVHEVGDTAGGYGIPMRIPQRIPMRIPQMPGVQWPDSAPHVGAVCGHWMCGLRVGRHGLNVCFCRLRTCCVARAGLQWASSGHGTGPAASPSRGRRGKNTPLPKKGRLTSFTVALARSLPGPALSLLLQSDLALRRFERHDRQATKAG